ncbi:YceI family protein [Phaeobacter sp.]|uniref:YceI family protein n=1 Tax=Phaeobacter sp. TaxID=1902409 RepID=UPI0025F24853|nr:YceI family protein [Phaeobacter sp.]
MKTVLGCAVACLLSASAAFAGGHSVWKSVDAMSSVAFGSIKANEIGEVHHFTKVDGTVGENGTVTVSIDLGSVETNIDIRNERMVEHIFKAAAPTAVLSGTVDLADFDSLAVGDTALSAFEGVLQFAGAEADIDADMLVARLGEDRVLVTTADFIMLSTYDLGIDPGLDVLQELASLDSITRAVPVTVRMVFQK